MTTFTVRVELHHADEDDYETLHVEMENRGFVRWIFRKDGKTYQLPTAEYNLTGTTLERRQVLELAKAAAGAAKPSPTPWILVTEAAGRT